jgi:hypothetical protein
VVLYRLTSTVLQYCKVSLRLWEREAGLRLGDRVDKYTVKGDFPLAQYAAEHWVRHAQFKDVSSHIREATEYLFNADKPCFSAWLRVHDIDVNPLESFLYRFAPYPPG